LYFLFPSSAPTEIYSLSLHDALPIWRLPVVPAVGAVAAGGPDRDARAPAHDRARDDLRAAGSGGDRLPGTRTGQSERADARQAQDRKSTRLNSSHRTISYAVFCLKKK